MAKTSIKLPEGYFWIPNFEGRYAMRTIHGGNTIDVNSVFSFVYPGMKGLPHAINLRWSAGRYVAVLSQQGMSWKTQYAVSNLKAQVEKSAAYQSWLKSKEVSPKAKAMQAVHGAAKVVGGKSWIVGTLEQGTITFASKPKLHLSKQEADAEATRLASTVGGAFVVVETVTKVSAAKVLVESYI